MKSCVLTACYGRPEFLSVCIEQITKADKAKDQYFIFLADYGFHKENLKVINSGMKGFDYEIVERDRPPSNHHRQTKQSRNVLEGYRQAVSLGFGLIHSVEDDIFVGKDYFTLTEDLHKSEPDAPMTILSRNHNTRFDVSSDPGAYYFGLRSDYQGWGVCFKAEFLEIILQYANLDYYKDPHGYCARRFPGSMVGHGFVEQDGLIRRVMENMDMKAIFPHVPRAFHAGFYGMNRGGYKRLSVAKVKDICFNQDEMRKHCLNDGYYEDSRPENMETSHTNVKLIQCQHL